MTKKQPKPAAKNRNNAIISNASFKKRGQSARKLAARWDAGLAKTLPCVSHYASALLDPFSTPAGACVPKFPTIQSAKRVVFIRGTGSTGATSKFGGIAILSSFANNATAAVCTDATWVQTNGSTQCIPILSEAGTTAYSFNSGYSGSEIGTGLGDVQVRLVALGVRVRSLAPLQTRGGLCFSLEEPSHRDLSGATRAQVTDYDSCNIDYFDDCWVECVYQPRDVTDFDYYTNQYGTSAGSNRFLGIGIFAAAVDTSFEFQVFGHYELIGSSVRGKTESHSSSEQTDNVISALAQMPPNVHSQLAKRPDLKRTIIREAPIHGASMWSRLASGLLGGVTRIGTTMVGGALGGPMGAAAGNAIGYSGQMALMQ